ncbi:hypothetical protein [Chryseobacterium sp. CH21]|uniref:hypothetical protein n=1 Tax=Chryseobacterium sp. CH21 TaxID=713556 RepID=UPI0013E96229|nr:hypothetical protein [Chryseobacterium sp. CH21]
MYTDYSSTQSTITYRFADVLKIDEETAQDLADESEREKIRYITTGLRLTAYF